MFNKDKTSKAKKMQNEKNKVEDAKRFLKLLEKEAQKREGQISEFWKKALPIYEKVKLTADGSIFDVAAKIMGLREGNDQAIRQCAAYILGVPEISNDYLYRAATVLFSPEQTDMTSKGECLTMWVDYNPHGLKQQLKKDLATTLLEQAVNEKAKNYPICALILAEMNFANFQKGQKTLENISRDDPKIGFYKSSLHQMKGLIACYASIGYFGYDGQDQAMPKEFLTRVSDILKQVVESYRDADKDFILNLPCDKSLQLDQLKSTTLILMTLSRHYASNKNYGQAITCLEKAWKFTLFLENEKILSVDSQCKSRIESFCLDMLNYLRKCKTINPNEIERIHILRAKISIPVGRFKSIFKDLNKDNKGNKDNEIIKELLHSQQESHQTMITNLICKSSNLI